MFILQGQGILILIAFAAALLIGCIILPYLRSWHLGQHERLEGPNSHLVKEGTPTFGGFIFLIPFVFISLLHWWHNNIAGGVTYEFAAALLCIVLTAILGFYDDYVKVRKDKEGLTPKRKSQYLLVIYLLYALYFVFVQQNPQSFFVLPFYGTVTFSAWPLKILFVLFVVFYLYCCSNAVNITDGVDGLCSSVTIVVLAALTYMLHLQIGRASNLRDFIQLDNFAFSAVTLIACLLAFLVFNFHPARVFMGDLGSLALGTVVSLYLLQFGWMLAFLFLGVIYWVEILSDLIQFIYFRKTGGKRIFKMAPIHHHFELSNWSEVKIVAVFSAVTAVGCFLGIWLFSL